MAVANRVIDSLITAGLLTEEFREVAVEELHRELTRRSRRLSQVLAAMVSDHQMALHFAGGV